MVKISRKAFLAITPLPVVIIGKLLASILVLGLVARFSLALVDIVFEYHGKLSRPMEAAMLYVSISVCLTAWYATFKLLGKLWKHPPKD